jgi:hypothetical protein
MRLRVAKSDSQWAGALRGIALRTPPLPSKSIVCLRYANREDSCGRPLPLSLLDRVASGFGAKRAAKAGFRKAAVTRDAPDSYGAPRRFSGRQHIAAASRVSLGITNRTCLRSLCGPSTCARPGVQPGEPIRCSSPFQGVPAGAGGTGSDALRAFLMRICRALGHWI